MTKKIDPALKKKAGRKSTFDRTPELRDEWQQKLTRVVAAASGNFGVVKTRAFFSIKEIRARWGNEAVNDFKSWFEASRLFNQEVADELTMKLERGHFTQAEFDKALATRAFSWVWSLQPDRRQEAWQVARGIQSIKE